MENTNQNTYETRMESESYLRAKKKMESLRGFYTHLGVYIVINSIFTIRSIYEHVQEGFTLKEAIFDGEIYTLWIIWGLAIAIHGFNVFSSIKIFNNNWEERKIEQYMKEDSWN